MNTLLIQIRENCLQAVVSCDGVLEYCRTFDFEPMRQPAQSDDAAQGQHHPIHAPAADNPFLIYYDTDSNRNPWDLAFKQIIRQIRSEHNIGIDATHLVIPHDDVVIATHQLPRMPRQDAEKLIARKIIAESREEFPPFSIIPAVSDQKTQTWMSLYIPTATLLDYRKVFAANRVRLSSITTPVNAMIDAFRSVREAIFNSHAVFEIQRGYIGAYYISSEGILHFQRLPYATAAPAPGSSAEEIEKHNKQQLFKIIDTIFRINSQYQAAHPQIPLQMAWVCGLEVALEDVAVALRDAMGIEAAIAPAMPTGLPEESGYVALAGFASALENNTAVTYAAADFFRRFPLRKTSGMVVYTVSALAALLAVSLTEKGFRNQQALVQRARQSQAPKGGAKPGASAAYGKNLEAMQKLTSRQFVFYDLFRELANDLPDGVYLENLEFHLKEDKGILDISALARLSDKVGEEMLLSRLMEMFHRSAILKKHREPLISVVAKDKERYLKISITSEVNPLDTSK